MGRVREFAVVSCSHSHALVIGHAIDMDATTSDRPVGMTAAFRLRKRRATGLSGSGQRFVGPERQQPVLNRLPTSLVEGPQMADYRRLVDPRDRRVAEAELSYKREVWVLDQSASIKR